MRPLCVSVSVSLPVHMLHLCVDVCKGGCVSVQEGAVRTCAWVRV